MKWLFLISTVFIFQVASSQTCCSSGIPIASNLGFQSKGKNIMQFTIGVDHNRLTSLYTENKKLSDDSRLRITNSYLGRVAYGISDNFQIELLIPYISQYRRIRQNNGQFNEEGGFGIGDITLLAQSEVLNRDFLGLNVGAGLKLPTGSNVLRNNDGFLLVNDLQLGSNAFDYIFRTSVSFIPAILPTTSFFANGTFLIKGTNKKYLGSEKYKFGNEFQANLGISNQWLLFNTLIYPSISLRYRWASRDRINNILLPNTGGVWLFGKASMGMAIIQTNRISVNVEYPLLTKVDGTQLSPDYIINLAFYKEIDLNPNQIK